jgi:type IV fimbrial biogenesis protein FimT
MQYDAKSGIQIHAGRAIRPARLDRGVTLIELIFTVTILAILTMIAVPSFRDASLGSRLSSISSDLYTSVQLARSEAIKSNATLTLCASTNGATCSGASWEDGWIVRNAAGNVLYAHAALPDGFTVAQAGGTASLSFQPIGVGASAAVFTVCRDTPLGNQERLVRVTATGLAYVSRRATGSCP